MHTDVHDLHVSCMYVLFWLGTYKYKCCTCKNVSVILWPDLIVGVPYLHSSSGDSSGIAMQRLFSITCNGDHQNQYRVFVDRALKTSGLKELMKTLRKFISPALELAKFALTPTL